MTEQEFADALDAQRVLLEDHLQLRQTAAEHAAHRVFPEAFESEREAGNCLLEVLQLTQKVGEAQWEELQTIRAERDALAATLATIKAALPKWRHDKRVDSLNDSYYLVAPGGYEHAELWSGELGVWRCNGARGPTVNPTSLEEAKLAVTEALGLPPCGEVIDV